MTTAEQDLAAVFDADDRGRPADRAAGLDAGGLPQDADPADRPARPLRDHRDAAGGQLDPARAQPAPEVDPAGQGPGRGRPRHVPLRRGRDARRGPRGAHREAHREQAEVLLDLQLPDAVLRRRRRDRLAGGRRGDLQPGAAVPLLLRAVRAGDDPHLQGGVVPPAAGLRAAAGHGQRHRRAAGDGAGVDQPVLVAVADDVRAAGRRLAEHPAVDGLGDQAAHQRRAAPALRGHDGAAGRGARRHAARRRAGLERGARALRLQRAGLDRVQGRDRRLRSVQRAAAGAPAPGPRGRRLGARGGAGLRGQAARPREVAR